MKRAFSIPPASLDSIAARFRALGEPMRLRILQHLLEGERSVSLLAQLLETTQSNTSRHLKVLSDAGLTARRKEGLEVIYSIADPVVSQLCQLMCESEESRARTLLAHFQPAKKARYAS